MNVMTTLDQLKLNLNAEICTLSAAGEMRRRLLDLGFVPGAQVCCLFAGPSGDPRAYLIKNTVVALRRTDASTIHIRKGDLL